jgi:hypothetical protein
VIAVTVLIIPMFAPYNQVLLLPPILLLIRDWSHIGKSWAVVVRMLKGLLVVSVVWQWIGSCVLVALSFVRPAQNLPTFWSAPFWTLWIIPVAVTALMLVVAHRGSFPAQELPYQRKML